MTKKISYLVVVLVMALSQVLNAQSRKVTGTITDATDGTPLPGVNIMVKGTTQGNTSDADGKYEINVSDNAVLLFSFIGYADKEVTVGAQSVINVAMESSATGLDEVVVTALGIKKQEKTLTYAQQQIGGDEITKSKELNFVNSLAGKTSGIQLKKNASGAGGSTKIILRGNKSIHGVSTPLFVIDGIPMVNHNSGNPNDFWGGKDGGDGLSQINPDDIESMSVLKGANAAALYGSQGANGVIIITTKKGKKGKVKGSFSSSVAFDSPLELPDLQYSYGSDGSGDLNWSNTKGSYDDKFVEDFFQTGYSLVNSLTLSGGTEKSTAYFSYSNTSSAGIIPNNHYYKHNLTVKQSSKFFNDKLTVSSRVMLTDEKINNKPQSGYYFNPLTGLYLFPRDKNFSDYKTYEKFDPQRNIQTQNWHVDSDRQQNPYWIINNNKNYNKTKRMIANLSLAYELTKDLKLQVRGNYDYAANIFEKQIMAGTVGVLSHANGRWQYNETKNTQIYGDAILTYNKKFGDFDVNAVLGTSYEHSKIGDGVNVDSDTHGLQFANEFNFQNLDKQVLVSSVIGSELKKQSIFGNVQIGYKGMLYLDLSGRNDWSSSLAYTDNYSYFYPSFGLTALLNEMVELPEIIDIAKFRTSYSIVSNEVPAFFTNPRHSIINGGVNTNTEKPFKELKPEDQKSFEIGMDWRFFGNRLGLDFTYYRVDNKNQFIPLNAPSGSGYTKFYVNAGHIRNSGFEFTINTTPYKTDDFKWETNINYTTNNNEIVELHEELKGKYRLSSMDGYSLYITEGGSFGDIYVSKFDRDEQGRIKIDDKGKPTKTDPEKIGNSNPDFLLGWNNNLSYKNFTLSFLIDGKFGGKAVSMTEAILDGYGASQNTASARDNGGVVINGVDPSGNAVSKIDAKTYYTAVGGRDGIMENYVYDATNIRLRQLALSYYLPVKNSVINNATFSIVANNLFFIYKDAPFDPDLSMSSGNGLQSVEHFTTPSTRTIGFNIKVNF